jgi:UPF0755 protein
MRKKSSCLLLFLILFCSAAAFGLWFIWNIPSQAEAKFGPASTNLDPSQKLLLSWRLLQNEDKLTTPANPFGTEIDFQIALGESPTSVSRRLEGSDLIIDAGAFRDFLVYAGLDTQIQAGNYQVSPTIPGVEIAYILLDATPTEVPFAVLSGWRLEEIAASLPNSGLTISPEEFLSKAKSQNLEGYLLPGIYIVAREASTEFLLDLLFRAFEEALTPEIQNGIENQGISIDEAVRLASIVEREAVIKEERPLIASVFLNRLAIGMKLEADPTVQYALGYNHAQGTWWTNPLTHADLATDSPYNTYLYPGLPPGPISSPSMETIRAVALPAQTPYYFFRATCDGSGRHNFAETFEEHVGNACP